MSDGRDPGWRFQEGFEYEFSTLDPMSAHVDPPAIAAYETLVVKGADGLAKAGLAESLEPDPAGTTWTLRLRDGLRFHSGAACDARAVVRSLDAVRWQLGDGRQLWYWDAVDQVRALDGRTLQFTLHHPSVRFPSLLWGTHTAIHNEELRLAEPDRFGTEIVDGTGPYRLGSWSSEKVVLQRWDEYRDHHFDGPTTIEWRSIRDGGQRVAELEAGQLDCIHSPPPAQVQRLAADPRYKSYIHPQAASMYLSLDWHHEIGFADHRVREAISLAIDRDAIVDVVFGGLASVMYGPLPPGHDFYDSSIDAHHVRELGAAQVLLDGAGWVVGSDGVRKRDGLRLEFRCVVQEDEVFRAVAGVVREQLRQAGVALKLDFVRPFADFYTACRDGAPAAISKWLWQDPVDALIGFASTATAPFPNWSNASSARLDRAFDEWTHATTNPVMAEAATEVQRAFVDDLPYIPLLTPHDVWVWRQEVVGFEPSARTLYPTYLGIRQT